VVTVRLLSLVGAAFVVVGSSCAVPESDLQRPARFEATIAEHRIDVSIWIWEPGIGLYAHEIAPDEHVQVAFRDQVVDCLFRNGIDPAYEPPYVAAFALTDEVAADETLTLSFTRGDEEVADVVGTAPAPFTLDAPAASPYQTELTVHWSPTSRDAMSWEALSGPYPTEGPIREDPGALTIPWEVLDQAGSDFVLELQRMRESGAQSPDDTPHATITQTRKAHVRVGP